MEIQSPEDHRGVDVWDIRERLRLTPAQRVQHLVDVVRVFSEIRASAAAPR